MSVDINMEINDFGTYTASSFTDTTPLSANPLSILDSSPQPLSTYLQQAYPQERAVEAEEVYSYGVTRTVLCVVIECNNSFEQSQIVQELQQMGYDAHSSTQEIEE